MSRWLLLADPKSYDFDDLQRDGRAVWNGVKGSLAQKHLRGFKKGDRALVYHTAPDKAIVGTARVTTAPYADPEDASGKRVVVDVEPLTRLGKPVTLAALKHSPRLAEMVFLKIQRIAVSPVSRAEFEEIIRLGRA
jgi:predicted RNA-binding protein with PUA-like domain